MNPIQLEFDLNNDAGKNPELLSLRQEMEAMKNSVGKVRRKMFAELGEMKKTYFALYVEAEKMKDDLRKLKQEKTDWIYKEGEYLFQINHNHLPEAGKLVLSA